MKIRDAKDVFAHSRSELVNELSGITTWARKSHFSSALSNANFLHALVYSELMMRHTDEEFLMVTGGSGDGFIACLKDTFLEMLSRLKASGGKARIVVVDGSDTNEVLEQYQKQFSDTLEYVSATSKGSQISHYIVCDGDMVRDEEPHGTLADSDAANIIKADVYFYNPGVADVFRSRFNRLWTNLGSKQAVSI